MRTCGRTSSPSPKPPQADRRGGRYLHLRWPRTGTAGPPAGPEPQASQPHKEAPPRTSIRLFGAPTPPLSDVRLRSGTGPVPCRTVSGPASRDWAVEVTDHPREAIEGGSGACGPEPGRSGLCPLGPVQASACPDGRLGALPGPRAGRGSEALRVKRPVGPAGGMENTVAPDRSAASPPDGFPHLPGRARPAHRLHRHDGCRARPIGGKAKLWVCLFSLRLI